MHAEAAYDELIRRTRRESLLVSVHEVLGWDELTYLPRAGVAHRGEQMALLAGMLHEQGTDPRLGELLDAVERSELVRDPLAPAAVNVRVIRWEYQRQSRRPRSLVEEIARVTSVAQNEWEIARKQNDYARFRPWLEKVVALKRQEAEALGYDTIAYDALLEEYEPGATSTEVSRLFDSLREELVPLVNALTYARRRPDVSILERDYPLDKQRAFAELVAAALGFDFERGRLDTATHPFCCSVGPDDCRITTRYNPGNFSDCFFCVLHEVGHGLYDQGLDRAHHGTPMGEAVSLGVHESQSRLWENLVGRSRAFWEYFFPPARRTFPAALGDVALDDFHFAVNNVEPTPIRATADEVTYNLHILLRFDLERALLAGDLKAADLPAAWDEAYRHTLGITPRNDAEGCLQDGHWASGLIGYFPTYTLGNLFAAQLFARANGDLGDQESAFAGGRFDGLLGWLRERIHRHGCRYPANRLIEQASGATPDPRCFVQGLRRKYLPLYGVAGDG
jgi:carboxypeptidase Taq